MWALIAEVARVRSFRLLAPVPWVDAVLIDMVPGTAFVPFGLAPGAVHKPLGAVYRLRGLVSEVGNGILGSSLSLFSS